MTVNHHCHEPNCTVEEGELDKELRYTVDTSLGEALDGDEEGSATVAIVGMIAALLIITTFVVAALSVYAHRSQLQGVADMAALAGADATPISLIMVGGSSPIGCATSQAVVELNDVQLDTCDVDTLGDIRVEVSRPVLILGLSVVLEARARAGPAAPLEGSAPRLRSFSGGG